MPNAKSGVKARIYDVVGVAKTIIHWGFLPTIIYLGIRRGGTDGMPAPTLIDVLLPMG